MSNATAITCALLLGACASDGNVDAARGGTPEGPQDGGSAVSQATELDVTQGASPGQGPTDTNEDSNGTAAASPDSTAPSTEADASLTDAVDRDTNATDSANTESEAAGPDTVESAPASSSASPTLEASAPVPSDAPEAQAPDLHPPPLNEPDLSDLVTVNGPYALLRVADGGSSTTTHFRLEVIELDSGQIQPVADSSEFYGDVQVSPQRTALFFDGLDSTAAAEQTVMHLRPDGFTAPRKLLGYSEETIGGFSQWDWTNDGRFAAVWREPITGQAYLDVIDGHSGGRVGGVPVPQSGAMFGFGHYTYSYATDDPDRLRFKVFSIDEQGLWERDMTQNEGLAHVGPDGTIYFMSSGDAPALYRMVPRGEPVQVPLPEAFEPSGFVLGNADQVLVQGATEEVLRIGQDGASVEAVAGVTGWLGNLVSYSADGRWALATTTSATAHGTAIIGTSELSVAQLPTSALELGFEYGDAGNHFFYKTAGSELTLVAPTAEGMVSTAISDTADAQYSRCLSYPFSVAPPDKNVMGVSDDRLLLLDLSEAQATTAAWIEVSEAGATLQCPIWSADGQSFVYTEDALDETRLYRVLWGESGPGEPELVHFSNEGFTALGLQ